MKSLKENLNDTDEILGHFIVEFEEWDNNMLLESAGIPDGLKEDSAYIAKKIIAYIKTNPDNKKFTLSFHKNQLKLKEEFNILVFNIIRSDKYNSTEGEVLRDKCGDKYYIINIKLPFTRHNNLPLREIYASVGHELLHCYVQQNNLSDKTKTLFQRSEELNYYDYFKLSDKEVDNVCKAFFYAINPEEVNAFIAQITLEISGVEIKDIKDAKQRLDNNDIYKLYKENVFTFLKKNKKYTKEICKNWRELTLSDRNYSDSQIIHKLQNRVQRIKERFNKILPRLFYENYSRLRIMDGPLMSGIYKLRSI